MKNSVKKILFVCLGNICRSSMAHGILRAKIDEASIAGIEIDSAGTSNWHIGKAPDGRAIAITRANNIDISSQQARQVEQRDFEHFDLIIAMDKNNLSDLSEISPIKHRGKIQLCLEYSKSANGGDVPDPYYGGDDGFKQVLDLLDEACQGITEKVILSSP